MPREQRVGAIHTARTRSGTLSLYTRCLRPLLFRFDAEATHEAVLSLAQRVGRSPSGRHLMRRLAPIDEPRLSTHLGPLRLQHPIGLAAGFDKNGRIVQCMDAIGFSHVEIGSVSAHPSSGNARPRLFRLPQDEAIVVNYGVPNEGAEAVASRLALTPPLRHPLGVNLVETNTGQPTDTSRVVDEYLRAATPFCRLADYVTLNLNCPNTTAGVSPFDDMHRLDDLLAGLGEIAPGIPPVLLKFTAHTDRVRASNLIACAAPHPHVAGFVFNLPPGKNYALTTPPQLVDPMPGTLCGAPTRTMMDETLAFWARLLNDADTDGARFTLIGSGGITNAVDAYRKIRLGASALQIYTALIYQGPGLVRNICHGLVELMDRDGFGQLTDVIGVDTRRH